jgi:trimeric autotransporter adhesin
MQRQLLFLLAVAVFHFIGSSQNIFPSSGNVGIGTTTPLKLLHVNGFGAFGRSVTTANATRALNLSDADAVMRILRVHATNAPAIELLSRTTADGSNIAYWDLYAEPADKSFRIRDRVTGSNLDRLTIKNAGNIGIGTTAPNASALLELSSTSRGLLTPRMTQAQRNAIAAPAQGLLIFQTDGTRGFYYYEGGWKQLGGAGSGANTSLSNLTSPTAVNQHLLPQTTKLYDLGSASLSWRNLHLRDDIFLDGTRFVSNAPGTASFNAFVGSHAGLAVTTGVNNTALGHDALRNDTSGSNNTALGNQALFSNSRGVDNTAAGTFSLRNNTTGEGNTAFGARALQTNVSGFYNTASGTYAMQNNSTGQGNTATGYSALLGNTTGSNNVANGYSSLVNNTTGSFNTAVGTGALSSNSAGSANVAIGNGALYYNTTGSQNVAIGLAALNVTTSSQNNTAVGYTAGTGYNNGWNNVFVGAYTDVNGFDYYNVVAIGQGTICTAPSQVTIGNSATTAYRAYANWSNISDGRYKKNLQENVPGLAFINRLRPVTYTLDASALDKFLHSNDPKGQAISAEAKAMNRKAQAEKEAVVQAGFVAQEVEQAANALKFSFSGVDAPKNDKDVYALRYGEFVVPLVKAVQELDAKTKAKDDRIAKLEEENRDIRQELAELKALIRGNNNTTTNLSSAFLEAAMPNPSRSATTIRYGVPDGTTARLTLTNAKGQVIKELRLQGRRTGQVSLNTAGLSTGIYSYTLWVDGREAGSKQLVITK